MKSFILYSVIGAFLVGCISTTQVGDTQLKHTKWQLSHINGKLVANSVISIEFIEAMQVAGNGGCNRFFGEGIVRDSSLKVSHIGMTRKLCDKQTNQQEQMLLKMLQSGVPVLMIENALIFKGQPELRFRVAG
ncbi:META domain-containing protein [Pseudoalteromonas sp. JBTF-M23]|uniref:META domain-containing protein n=1 Tax=Pseudoalteromonas caenipelagi TaxID=2726988 RepID=A0A849VGP9_9GAMM|nr:META domain-containing protein [Pseudoalteromonas caenipelagi]NOU51044.1 META domain-containing protein [Pseudoalteromonas caenipelagi]